MRPENTIYIPIEYPEEILIRREPQTSICQRIIGLAGMVFLTSTIVAVPGGIGMIAYDYYQYQHPHSFTYIGITMSVLGLVFSCCYSISGFAEKHFNDMRGI